MSTTVCVTPTRWVSSSESRSCSSVAALAACSKSSVSQKIDAVSASAIGSRRCSGVRGASATLWNACPSSCASVEIESGLPSKFIMMRETPGINPVQ